MEVRGPTESMRDDGQTPLIHSQLAEYKACALIGLEYAVELREPDGIPQYACVVCDKIVSNFWIHWSSFHHRLQYLAKHYPTVVRKYRVDSFISKPFKHSKVIVEIMAEAIENYHGRLQLKSMSRTQFNSQPKLIIDNIISGFHYDEKFGPDFVNVVEEAMLQHNKVKEQSGDIHGIREHQQSLSYQAIANPSDNPGTKLQAVHLNQERHNWEKYRFMLEKRLMELTTLQRGFVESPETHPLYSQEWDMFWVRRYKQLKAENKVDPKTYDYKPEWIIYWTKRMNELFSVEVEKAKKEIKFGLGIPEEAEETDCQRYHLQTQSSRIVDHTINKTPVPVFRPHSRTHSRSPSSLGRNHQLPSRRRTRSRSPTRFEHELPKKIHQGHNSHLHSHSRDDNNYMNNGADTDDYYKHSSSRYCDSAIGQTAASTSKLIHSLAGRGSLKTYSFSSPNNQVPEQQFIDSYRKSLSTAPPGRLQQPDIYHGRKDMYTQMRTAYNISDTPPEELQELQTSAFKGAKDMLVRHGDGVEAFVANDRQIRTLAVTDINVDDGGITPLNWKKLEKPLTQALVDVLRRNQGPVAQFRDAGWYQGRIKLIEFKDERSPRLYQQALKSLGQIWRGASLDLVELSQVPNRPRTYARVPSQPSSRHDILSLIQHSNPHLPTHNWKVIKIAVLRDGTSDATIAINGESVALLDKTGGMIRYGSETIKLRVYREDA